MRRVRQEVKTSYKTRSHFKEITKAARKLVVFYVLMMSIVLLTIEVGSQILFFIYKGYFLFQRKPSEEFNIRDFSVLTNDARGYTAIPNYTNPNYGGKWFLSFDSFGFRLGKQTVTSAGQRNIVFIGDSVPFGWGVSNNSSLPSQFFERLQENSLLFGVVNAALPSYALAQAVARYKQEIHGRMAIDTVYLQIYDPAAQIAIRGSRWQPSDNWMNYPYISKSFLSRHSATNFIFEGLVSRLNINFGGMKRRVETFDSHDEVTRRRAHVHMQDELERLLTLSKTDGVRRLIVAPLTVPAQSLVSYYSPSRLSSIELVNQGLRDFARSHSNDVIFADTISLLSTYPEADVFIDRCCHLSERGNGIVADYLMTLLRNSGYFSHNRISGKM